MAAKSPRRQPNGKKPRKPRRKPGWNMRARVCESLAAHFGDGTEIAKQARIIIHFIDTNEAPSPHSDRPGLRLVDRGQ